jgi:DNA-binding transcriptional LysR family regulator
MDTLTSIKVFRQVVDSGSFVRAAERLDMSNATVSKHVMHAETRLGVRLLNRNSRFLSLTEPGRLYFDRCQSILEELRATELELGSLGRTPRGTLRLSAPSLVSGQWLANLLAEYRRRYPDVLVDLSFEDGIVNLVDEGFDLALRIASSQDSLPADLIARPLRPAMFCLAASHDYVKRRGAPQSPDDLAQHDFVAADDMLKCVLRPTAAQKTEVPLRVVLRCRSAVGVANAVAAGIGIAMVPAVLFDDPQFRDVLTPILPNYPPQRATLYAVYASRNFVPPKLRTFVDFIVEYLSQEPKRKATPVQALQAPPIALTPHAKVLCRLPEARLAT